jgi:hypothetical protein
VRPFVRVALTGLALAACTESATTPTPAPVAPPSTSRPTAPPPGPPPPPHTPPVAAPPSGPTFHTLGFRDGDLDLLQLGDEVLVQADTELARSTADGALAFVATDLARSGEWGESRPNWQIGAVGGRWPDNAWVTSYYDRRSTNPQRVHRRVGDAWVSQPNRRGLLRWSYSAVLAWHSGQVLGLRVWEFDPARGFVVDESGVQVPDRLERAVARELAGASSGFVLLGPRPTPTSMVLPAKFVVHSLAAAPTGELFVLGRVERSIFDMDYRLAASLDDEAEDPAEYDFKGPLQLLRWDAAGKHTSDELPAGEWDHLAVRSADEAYLVGSAQLLRFDGAAWTPSPAPANSFFDLSIAPGGALWAITRDRPPLLLQRPAPDAAWQPVPLPEQRFPDRAAAEWACDWYDGCALAPGDPDAAQRAWPVDPIAVRTPADDDIWVLGRTDLERSDVSDHTTHRTVVLRTRGPAGAPLRFPTDGDLIADASDRRRVRLDRKRPHRPHPCTEGASFVALHTLPADAAPTGHDPRVDAFLRDNPALLPAIESIQEIVIRGRRTVGLLVPPTDAATTRALLTALNRLVPGEPHRLDCVAGRILRGFDKATGAPIP